MESLLLIGSQEPALKRFKAHLVKRGFRVTIVGFDELERLEEAKERFSIGLVHLAAAHRLGPSVDRLRSVAPIKDLPLVALLEEGHLKELRTVNGLEDFLVGPVEPPVLETRVAFLLKKLNHVSPGTGIQIEKLAIDVDRYEVTLDGQPLELTYKEFELLKFLATHPGRVYSRDQLLNQVWGYDFIGGTRTVDVHIRRLRAKLGPKYATLIATVRNVGYKFLESL